MFPAKHWKCISILLDRFRQFRGWPAAKRRTLQKIDGNMTRSAAASVAENIEIIDTDHQTDPARQRRGDIVRNGPEHIVFHLA